jgi:pimeloyl-ACP methyl ester carboxylesterase
VPLGFRLASAAPEQISILVVQNGEICDDPNRETVWLDSYWEKRDPAAETRLRNSYRLQTTIKYHQMGASDSTAVSPDTWILDQYYLDQPDRKDIQAELMYDFGRNKAHHAEWQRYLTQHRPPLLVLWGKDSPVYSPFHAECYRKANPAVLVHFYAGGHFVLDEYAQDAAKRILDLKIKDR